MQTLDKSLDNRKFKVPHTLGSLAGRLFAPENDWKNSLPGLQDPAGTVSLAKNATRYFARAISLQQTGKAGVVL